MAASFGVSSAAVAFADHAVKSPALPVYSLPVIRSEERPISGRISGSRKAGRIATNAVAAQAESPASAASKPG